ncbi:MAG: YbaK/EbsC family protein [Bellilinea sp.]
MVTNNVTRLLTAKKIPFEAFELPNQKISGMETARRLGVDPQLIYKTMVVTRERGGKPILAVIPAPHQVDLKALAAFIGEKKLKLPTQREAEQITGLQAGGISPLALLQRGFQVILDEAALQHEKIHISGGQRGLNIRLPVNALIELTHARTAPISAPGTEDTDQD